MKTIKLIALGVVSVSLLGVTASAQAALTAYYSLNGNTNDSSGNGYNGTVNGTTNYGPGKGQTDAFSFDGGTNIATTTAANLGLDGGSFTIDAWVKFNNTGDMTIFGMQGSTVDQTMHLLLRSDKAFFGFYGDDTGGNEALNANTWYNIAWVYNDTGSPATNTQTIYVNGQLDATSAGHNDFAGTGEAYIGQSCCAGQMNGLIQDVAVFNTALSQAEVSEFLPEPSSVVALVGLCGMGLVGLVVRRRRAASQQAA